MGTLVDHLMNTTDAGFVHSCLRCMWHDIIMATARTWVVEIVSVTGLSHHSQTSGDALDVSQSFSLDNQQEAFESGTKSQGNGNEIQLHASHKSDNQQSTRSTTNANGGESGKKVIRYVMLVKDTSSNESWKVDHRYSDFLHLRKKLIKQKFYSIPMIKCKSSLLHQQLTVINDRAVVLQRFINDCIHIVGINNTILNEFLTNGDNLSNSLKSDRYSHYSHRTSITTTDGLQPNPEDMRSVMGSHRGRSFRIQTPAILSSKPIQPSIYSEPKVPCPKSHLSPSSLRDIWDHIYAIPISWCGHRTHCLQHANGLINQLVSLERQIINLRQSLNVEKERSSSLSVVYGMLTRFLSIPNTSAAEQQLHSTNTFTIDGNSTQNDNQRRKKNWLLILEVLLSQCWLAFIAFELFSFYVPHIKYYHAYDIPKGIITRSVLDASSSNCPHSSAYNLETQLPKGLFLRVLPQVLSWVLELVWRSTNYAYFLAMITQLFHLFVKIAALFCAILPGNRNFRKQLLYYVFFFITIHTLYFAHCDVLLKQLRHSLEALVYSFQITSEQEFQQKANTFIYQSFQRLIWTTNYLTSNHFISLFVSTFFLHFLPFTINILLSDIMVISFKCILFCENIVMELKDVLVNVMTVSQDTFLPSVIFTGMSILVMYFFFQFKYSARACYLYLLGSMVIIIYLWITLFHLIVEDILSKQMTHSLFETVDSWIAPFVVSRLKQHKSIFIKFGQYVSMMKNYNVAAPQTSLQEHNNMNSNLSMMKVELPLSITWAHCLQQLQDHCEYDDMASSEEHHGRLKDIVEIQLNKVFEKVLSEKTTPVHVKLEDIFETFDPIPVASASVAQVHFATLNIAKLSNIRFKQTTTSLDRIEKEKLKTHDDLDDGVNARISLSELIGREHVKLFKRFYTAPWFSVFAHTPLASNSPNIHTEKPFRYTWKPNDHQPQDILQVAVKVQHIDIEDIMMQDMRVVQILISVATFFDARWKPLNILLESWKTNLANELNFRKEAENMENIGQSFEESHVGVMTPIPIPGLSFKSMLVMTCLHGYTINDEKVLNFHGINGEAMVRRIAHAYAHQFLVIGLFNPHPHFGNLRICLGNDSSPKQFYTPNKDPLRRSRKSDFEGSSDGSDVEDSGSEVSTDCRKPHCHSCLNIAAEKNLSILPGLLDFGIIMKMPDDRRYQYCQLIVALHERDVPTAEAALEKLGYESYQTTIFPEHGIEFFYRFFRDSAPSDVSMEHLLSVQRNYNSRREFDVANNLRDPSGRIVAKLPDDFIYISRIVVMIRKLCENFKCSCQILHILALHAKLSLKTSPS